ncbi:MAG: hypothetical protein WCG50_07440 [Rhodoferax sp.]|uniref:hypothetical protein n=1 Tax=Rhodoferax sp. TaxID=50421 RepID=UPI00301B36BB
MSLFSDSVDEPSPENRVKDIRQAMIDCIEGLGNESRSARVLAQVLYSPDIQSLWYLRSDVLTLMASLQGESVAHARISPITDMFVGLLPAAQKSRPNRLSR